jgi:tetratricopeptide (TPR) repeat protein
MEMGRTDEAGEKFRRAIELAPEQPAGHFWHGDWLMRCGRDEEAIAALEKTLLLDPTFPGAHMRLGELNHRRHDPAGARKHLRAELLLRPQDPQMLLQLSNLLLDSGQGKAAVACLRRLISLDADNASAWQNLAVAQFTTGRYLEGIASCHEALRREPANLMAIYNLASAYEHLKRFDEALTWVRKGLEVCPSDTPLQKLELRIRVLRFRDRVLRIVRGVLLPGAKSWTPGVYRIIGRRGRQ